MKKLVTYCNLCGKEIDVYNKSILCYYLKIDRNDEDFPKDRISFSPEADVCETCSNMYTINELYNKLKEEKK